MVLSGAAREQHVENSFGDVFRGILLANRLGLPSPRFTGSGVTIAFYDRTLDAQLDFSGSRTHRGHGLNSTAGAQGSYSGRLMKIVVPVSPGSGTDLVARNLISKLP